MAKKKTSPKTKLPQAKKTTHIHYFYVIIAVIGLGTAIAAFTLPNQKNSVLGLNAGTASSNADSGRVDIRITGEDRTSFTEIKIDAGNGEEIEFDDASGDSNQNNNGKRGGKGKDKAAKMRDRADKKGNKNNKDKRGKKNKERRNRSASEGAMILPDQAIETLLDKGVIQELDTSKITGETTTDKNGEMLYVIQGASQKKIFGLFPITIEKKVTVSAENGEVEKTDMSIIDRIFTIVSF